MKSKLWWALSAVAGLLIIGLGFSCGGSNNAPTVEYGSPSMMYQDTVQTDTVQSEIP
ncbi:MAG: hypothetical protein K5893_01700 [Prevotella sp.]|nr:hypothetical protein [Prevotella sp.]